MDNQKLKNRCVIIAGSPDFDLNFINKTVSADDFIICADKGLEYALKAGVAPNLVIGDFDSCGDFAECTYPIITLPREKDDTDAMHSAEYAVNLGYTNIILLCAIGGRIDHSLGNIATLQFLANRGAKGELCSPDERILFLEKGHHEFNGLRGKTFSMFPFGCEKVLVSNFGMKYPLDKVYIRSDVTLGISNIFISDKTSVDIYDGNAIIIINLKEV